MKQVELPGFWFGARVVRIGVLVHVWLQERVWS